jgi:hypothetical protein
VVIRPETRILLGESDLTLEAIRNGERAIGHTVSIQGGRVPDSRRIVADVIAVGPRVEQDAPARPRR